MSPDLSTAFETRHLDTSRPARGAVHPLQRARDHQAGLRIDRASGQLCVT